MPDPGRAEPPRQRTPPTLTTIWLGILAAAGLWCLLPLWETAFIEGSWPGIYWLFIAGNLALRYIGVAIGAAALAEVVMIVLLATRRPGGSARDFTVSPPGRPDKTAADNLGIAAGIGFMVLLLLLARAGIAVLSFAPAIDRHMDEIETGQHRYFLAHHTAAKASEVWYSFVQCDPTGVWCAQVQDVRTDGATNGSAVTPQAFLNYDGDAHAIEVIEEDESYFIYSLDG